MGTPWIVSTPEHERAFREDWLVHRLTLDEMAALHGFRSHKGVHGTVARLGLPLRQPRGLSRGRWVARGLTMVWEEAA